MGKGQRRSAECLTLAIQHALLLWRVRTSGKMQLYILCRQTACKTHRVDSKPKRLSACNLSNARTQLMKSTANTTTSMVINMKGIASWDLQQTTDKKQPATMLPLHKEIPEGDGALLVGPCCQWFAIPGLTPPSPPAWPPLSGDIIGDGSCEARGVTKLPSDTETDTGWLVRPSRGVAVGEGRAKAGLGGAALGL